MIENNWGSATSSYHAGTIDFAQFAKRTRKERDRWVDGARRKLSPIPVWHAKEDSEQDFLLDIFLRGQRFDPSKASAGGYFRHGIHNVGKRIQKARGVEQHRRSGQARFERTFAALGLDEPPEEASSENAERAALRAEYYAILVGLCETEEQLAAVCALQAGGGNLAGATARLYEDPDLRRRLRLPTRRRAASLIERTVSELIAAYGKKEEEAQL